MCVAPVSNSGSTSWAEEDFELPSAPTGESQLSSFESRTRPGYQLGRDETPRGRLRASVARHQQEQSTGGVPFIDHASLPREPPYNAYICNLAFDTSARDLELFMADCKPLRVHLTTDKDTGRSRGFGYAEFPSIEGLTLALMKSNQVPPSIHHPFTHLPRSFIPL